MTDQQEQTFVPAGEVAPQGSAVAGAANQTVMPPNPGALPNLAESPVDAGTPPPTDAAPATKAEAEVRTAEGMRPGESDGNGVDEGRRWHVQAGRKGACRVHQLIQEGRLYEQEHGLTRGRQRLRQLIELGK